MARYSRFFPENRAVIDSREKKSYHGGVMRRSDVKQNQTVRGILCILLAAFFFSLMTLFVRLSGDLPVMQKAFFRNLVASAVAASILLRSGEGFRIHPGCAATLLKRCAFGTAGLIGNFWAIDRIGIADANMLNKLAPFFAVIMSIFILKELPGIVDILSVLLAFAGAVLVVRPSAGLASLPALAGVAGGFFAGLAYTYVRKLGKMGERSGVIVLCFSVFSCLVCLPFLLFDYHPMTGRQWLFLLLAGCAAAGGQLSVTAAYRLAPAREISVYDYSQVIYAALLGILVLGEWPQPLSVVGYAVIIAAAVMRYLYGRRAEKRKKKENA